MHARPGADTKSGGGGVLSVLGSIREAGGGGRGVLSASRPMRKAGGRWGCCLLQVRYEKLGGGGGCLPCDDLYLRLCARA